MISPSDGELARAACDGSDEAAATLFRRYWAPAWRAAYMIVHRRAVADDVAQEAFQRAFRALPEYDPTRQFGPWLHRIVVNRALDVVRRERRFVPLHEREEDRAEALEDTSRDPELLGAVARLDPDRRVLIALRYWLDYSPPEIAELLGLPVGTISSRLSRALAELRTILEERHVS